MVINACLNGQETNREWVMGINACLNGQETKNAHDPSANAHMGVCTCVSSCSDKNDPKSWTSPKEFKIAQLAEDDPNDKFDRPPLQSADEVAEALKYKRTNKVRRVKGVQDSATTSGPSILSNPVFSSFLWGFDSFCKGFGAIFSTVEHCKP